MVREEIETPTRSGSRAGTLVTLLGGVALGAAGTLGVQNAPNVSDMIWSDYAAGDFSANVREIPDFKFEADQPYDVNGKDCIYVRNGEEMVFAEVTGVTPSGLTYDVNKPCTPYQ